MIYDRVNECIQNNNFILNEVGVEKGIKRDIEERYYKVTTVNNFGQMWKTISMSY